MPRAARRRPSPMTRILTPRASAPRARRIPADRKLFASALLQYNLDQQRAEHERASQVGVSTGERAVRRVQRSAEHLAEPRLLDFGKPRLRREAHPAVPVLSGEGQESLPIQQSGTERRRQIFRASVSGISTWRGIASTAPVFGFVHTPRRPSSRRSFRINAMASSRLRRASLFGLTQSVGAGDLRAVGDVPRAITLEHRRELVRISTSTMARRQPGVKRWQPVPVGQRVSRPPPRLLDRNHVSTDASAEPVVIIHKNACIPSHLVQQRALRLTRRAADHLLRAGIIDRQARSPAAAGDASLPPRRPTRRAR